MSGSLPDPRVAGSASVDVGVATGASRTVAPNRDGRAGRRALVYRSRSEVLRPPPPVQPQPQLREVGSPRPLV